MTVPALVGITPGDHERGRDLHPWIRALGGAGLPGLIVREPHLSRAALEALVAHAEAHVPWVAVHDRNPAARSLGRALHLAASEPPPARGPWGRSCHTRAEVEGAWRAGASWVTWSPVWAPSSKQGDARVPLGLDRFLTAPGAPVLALGGVTPERLHQLLDRGGHGAAVLGGLFGAADPRGAAVRCRAYLQASGSNGNTSSKES